MLNYMVGERNRRPSSGDLVKRFHGLATQPLYESPRDNVAGDVLVPAFGLADEALLASAYFTSNALSSISVGLAAYVGRDTSTLRLLLSPHLADEDLVQIRRGSLDPEAVVASAVEGLLVTDEGDVHTSALQEHAARCLGYLVAAGRAEIRFVLMRQGMFHPKQWLLRSGGDWLAVHGSGNATYGGLFANGEQMTVDKSWCDGPSAETRTAMMVDTFNEYWANKRDQSLTVSAPQAVELIVSMAGNGEPPTVKDFWASWHADHASGLEPELPLSAPRPPQLLSVPGWLSWQDGPFEHQGRAVEAYLRADGRGVLAIATGGGKTRTALIAATQLQNNRPTGGPMFIVVLVPTSTLVRQWTEDVQDFGIRPVQPSSLSKNARAARFAEIETALSTGAERTEVLVSTQQLFARDPSLRTLVDRLSDRGATTMIIGDEVHNLGSPTFIEDPPTAFNFRLGLSATPVRQYDSLGTTALFDFFGPEVFEFSLRDAIAAGCLVPYDYIPHRVALTSDEMERYAELTDELFSAGFHVDDQGQAVIPNSKVEDLLRRRRAVTEQASGKIPALREILLETGPQEVRRTLIYTSSKVRELAADRQIEGVNLLLQDLGIVAHELTATETGSGRAPEILRRFADEDYRVLTAMKVLDEGVDIPATETAFILASSTVEREWVQRRGRVLRKSGDKTSAVIHDFIAVPSDLTESAAASILRSELRRVRAFASMARNEWAADGPQVVAEELDSMEQEARSK